MRTSLAQPARPGKPAGGPSPDETAASLLAWYERHGRVLPWRVGPAERRRGIRPDPYRVWLSEVMLQQTTVKAVLPYFAAFTRRWPEVAPLAAAPENDVMAAWAGLGYYSRARNLIACARTVVAEHRGIFPRTAEALVRLPGIGAYTSAAIAAIAFDENVAVVDGNVERVVARLFAIPTPPPAGKEAVRAQLTPLVPAERPGEFAEALMDLGATICTPKRPACALCPLGPGCQARAQGAPESYPVKAAKRVRPVRYGTAFLALDGTGRVMTVRRQDKGLLGGMLALPSTEWGPQPGKSTPPFAADWRVAGEVRHTFTHFDLRLAVLWTRVERLPSAAPLLADAEAAMPTVFAKAVQVGRLAAGE